MLAHGIWLDAEDRALLRSSGAALAFCPSSNLFLGSGLFDWAAAQAAGTAVSMASDVGGGTSLSMLRTLADGYKVQAMAGRHVSAWALLHAATAGAAKALGLAHEIGALEPGLMADVVVWDKAIAPLEARRQAVAKDVHDAVFAWMTQGDDRHVVETWVAGGLRYRRPSMAEPQLRA
jgi:guanine deaminase